MISDFYLFGSASSIIFMMSVPVLSDVTHDQQSPVLNPCKLLFS